MGYKLKNALILICVMVLAFCLCSCSEWFAFNTAKNFDIADQEIVDAVVDDTCAYYLTSNGALYSPGADIDANCYVIYQDVKSGLVAENVRDFDIISYGGYYINTDDELYVWDFYQIESIGYTKNRGFQKVLDGVKTAKVWNKFIVYTDQEDNLYLTGLFCDKQYDLNEPLLLDNDVSCYQVFANGVVWVNSNGIFSSCGDYKIPSYIASVQLSDIDINHIEKFKMSPRYTVLLSNGKLWYIGDKDFINTPYTEIKNENEEFTGEPEVFCLIENAVDFSCECNTVVAVDDSDNGIVWGECLQNSSNDQEEPYWEILDGKVIQKDVSKFLRGSRWSVSFISTDHKSLYYGYWNQWGFCGNSSDKEYIGIKSDPLTWI